MNTRSKEMTRQLAKVTLEVRDGDENRTQVSRLLAQRISLRAINYETGSLDSPDVAISSTSLCCHPMLSHFL